MTSKEKINSALVTFLNNVKPGRAFNVRDFNPNYEYDTGEVARIFNSFVAENLIVHVCKGVYVKPKERDVQLDLSNFISDILYNGKGEPVGYLTYDWFCYKLGILAEEPKDARVALSHRHATIKRKGYTVRFVSQHLPINNKTVTSLQILDTLRHIDQIEEATPSNIVAGLKRFIVRMGYSQVDRMIELAAKYPSRTRALLGAILEITHCSQIVGNMYIELAIQSGLEIDIDEEVLPNREKWNLIAPIRNATE